MLKAEYSDILINVSILASVLQDQGKYKKIKKMNRRALKENEKALEAEHSHILISVSNLASVLRGQGKYKKIEKMNRRAL
jgi:NTP pyrophosphatase (non-canonical NTP hydrolase)